MAFYTHTKKLPTPDLDDIPAPKIYIFIYLSMKTFFELNYIHNDSVSDSLRDKKIEEKNLQPHRSDGPA